MTTLRTDKTSPEINYRTFRSPKSGIPLGYRTRTNGPESFRTTFVLELRAIPGWPFPPWQSIRALLKRASRCYGLRCVSCQPVTEQKEAKP
jgi:hypothetical protein